MQGRSIDASLNALGRRQSDALADRFRDVPLSAVYASPMKRAVETASAIAAHHELDLRTIPEMAEMAWGELEGKPIGEVSGYLDQVGGDWRAGRFDHRVGGGETILDVQERARTVLEKLSHAHSGGEEVLAVTHGRFLRVLLATALPGFDLTRMDEFGHANTGVYRLEASPEGFRVTLKNCTDHLAQLEV